MTWGGRTTLMRRRMRSKSFDMALFYVWLPMEEKALGLKLRTRGNFAEYARWERKNSMLQLIEFATKMPNTSLPSRVRWYHASLPLNDNVCLLPARAQWPIEPTHTVHILPVFRLLLLPHRIHVIPRHLRVLGTLETRESHHPSHHRCFRVRVLIDIHLRTRIGRLRLCIGRRGFCTIDLRHGGVVFSGARGW